MKKICLLTLALIFCALLPACGPAQTMPADTGSAGSAPTPDSSPPGQAAPSPDSSPAARPVLVVIPNRDFNPDEFTAVTAALISHGIPCRIAAPEAGEAVSMGASLTVNADLSFAQITAGEYGGLVFIGGTGTQALWEEEILQNIAREIYGSGGVAAAICLAPVILARAGLLDGRPATGFDSSEARAEYEKTGAQMEYATPVVIDGEGRIITGNGPGAAESFAQAVAEAVLSLG